MNEPIKKRLSELESVLKPKTCFCMVEMQDGTQAEKPIEEWYEHRHEWHWLRMTRGGNIGAVLLVLAAIDDEVAEHCMQIGDTAGALEMTVEAARFVAEYERRARP